MIIALDLLWIESYVESKKKNWVPSNNCALISWKVLFPLMGEVNPVYNNKIALLQLQIIPLDIRNTKQ